MPFAVANCKEGDGTPSDRASKSSILTTRRDGCLIAQAAELSQSISCTTARLPGSTNRKYVPAAPATLTDIIILLEPAPYIQRSRAA
jgi:hypothetical protein